MEPGAAKPTAATLGDHNAEDLLTRDTLGSLSSISGFLPP